MKEYNPLSGVPTGGYYLEEIICFGDFEVREERRILYTSSSKEELVDLCKKNNWACADADISHSGWHTHFIKQRGIL